MRSTPIRQLTIALLFGVALLLSVFLFLLPSNSLPTLVKRASAIQPSTPPYPLSDAITDLIWAPEDSIVRLADGSDNWPLTWGAGDLLYTAYGDGYGFEPMVEEKLSLGFASVWGFAPNVEGINIRSEDEQLGQGQTGIKASSLLAIDGVLYMWARNANQAGEECQLAWSTDNAISWTWSDWTFPDFGYCVFINYGQEYQGAPDDYVYTVTPKSSSAYEPADDFLLLRVNRSQMQDEDAYETFSGLGIDGSPVWQADSSLQQPVFTHEGRALRSSISYNAGLERYIWWQQIPVPDVDTRDAGGFGIYDAPNPWGPWTTVYYTDQWDVGPGESGHFPTKFMSRDGLTMYLVFSGNDSFSIRRADMSTSPRDSLAPTATATETATGVPTETATATPTEAATEEATETATQAATETLTQTPAPPAPAPATSTPSTTEQAIDVPGESTSTPMPTLAPKIEATATVGPSAIEPESTQPESPLATPLQAAQQLDSPLAAPAETGTATETATPTVTPTATSSPTGTDAPAATKTITPTPSLTETPSVTPLPAREPSTPTFTPAPTVTATSLSAPSQNRRGLFGLSESMGTLIIALLALVLIAITTLGIGAMIIAILYFRSNF